MENYTYYIQGEGPHDLQSYGHDDIVRMVLSGNISPNTTVLIYNNADRDKKYVPAKTLVSTRGDD